MSGALDPEGGAPSSDGAAAVRYPGTVNLMLVLGIRMRSSARADIVYLALPEVTAPRVFSLDDSDCAGPLDCPLAAVMLDTPVQRPGEPVSATENNFVLTTGSISVTSITANRMTGTFSGTAETLVLEGTPRAITITNGRFDVPITTLRAN